MKHFYLFCISLVAFASLAQKVELLPEEHGSKKCLEVKHQLIEDTASRGSAIFSENMYLPNPALIQGACSSSDDEVAMQNTYGFYQTVAGFSKLNHFIIKHYRGSDKSIDEIITDRFQNKNIFGLEYIDQKGIILALNFSYEFDLYLMSAKDSKSEHASGDRGRSAYLTFFAMLRSISTHPEIVEKFPEIFATVKDRALAMSTSVQLTEFDHEGFENMTVRLRDYLLGRQRSLLATLGLPSIDMISNEISKTNATEFEEIGSPSQRKLALAMKTQRIGVRNYLMLDKLQTFLLRQPSENIQIIIGQGHTKHLKSVLKRAGFKDVSVKTNWCNTIAE